MAYADDIALLAPTATAMRVMLHVCENYAKEYSVVLMQPSLTVWYMHLVISPNHQLSVGMLCSP